MVANMRRRSTFMLVGVLVIAVLGILRFFGKSAKAGASAEPSLRPVAVALVTRRPVVNSLTLSGAFRPYQQVDVHAKVAGFIRKIYVDVGDHVKEGQTLAVLEVPELAAQLTGSEAAVRAAEEQIHKAQGDVQRAKSSHAAAHSAYVRLKQA